MERWRGKVAIVTGASSGIGEAVVEKLVEVGINVVAAARREELLRTLAEKLKNKPGAVHIKKTDCSSEEELRELFDWTKENVGPVHILINNAGIVTHSRIIDGDVSLWRKVLDVNLLGYAIAASLAVKQMKEHKIDGQIVNVSSICAHYSPPLLPNMNVYCAAKHAVKAISANMVQELRAEKSKIKVSNISPGYVGTSIGMVNGYFEQLINFIGYVPEELKALSPEDVATSIMTIVGTPPNLLVEDMIIRPLGEEL